MNGKLVIGTELDTKSFDAQIEATRRKLEMLEKSADESSIPKQFRRSKQEAQQLQVEIEKTRNELIRLMQLQNKAGIGEKNDSKESEKNRKNKLKGLKKFALGLIGIRGLYSLARKAASTWLSQDTELAKKFQNVWLALGAALKPVLEWLSNAMYKLLGYLNEFVKAFTGGKVDIIATANAQAIKKQASAMKELKNQTYGFDELNIQQVNDSSNEATLGNIKIPELDPKIKKFVSDIGAAAGEIYVWLKKIIGWVNDNLGTGGVIMLGITTLLGVKALPALGGKGLLAVLAVILAIYDTLKLIGIVREWKDVKESADSVTKSANFTAKAVEGMKERIVEAFNGKTYEEKSKGIDNHLALLRSNINGVDKATKTWKENTGFSLKGIMSAFNGVADASWASREAVVKGTLEQIDALIVLAKQGDMTKEQYEEFSVLVNQYLKMIEQQNNDTLGQFKGDLDTAREKVKDLNIVINELDGKNANTTITTTYKVDAKDNTGDVFKKIQSKLTNLGVNLSKNVAADLLVGGVSPTNIISSLLKNVAKFSSSASVSYGATGGVLNKCASGSIINNPGRGVYIGANTIGGESGKEGLLPLTDPNAMTELGETIGRYITVNLTNITKLDSKTINKENVKISNDMSFIRNGGAA